MKTKFLLFAAMSVITLHSMAQTPQCKVDISMSGRQAEEVLEPGYTSWQNMAEELTVEGVTFSLSVPQGASNSLRTGWNKAFIQKAEYKAKNARLTGDGVNLDPNECGEFSLTIKGLPAGTHTTSAGKIQHSLQNGLSPCSATATRFILLFQRLSKVTSHQILPFSLLLSQSLRMATKLCLHSSHAKAKVLKMQRKLSSTALLSSMASS